MDFRKQTNFRSVTRNDPAVLEILETSVYSVIYQYDETAGEWEKQKQEGPLFVVRRCGTFFTARYHPDWSCSSLGANPDSTS